MLAQGLTKKQTTPDTSTLAAYLGAFAGGALVWQSFHDLGLSTFITLAAAVQCFAYTCLRLKISQQKSVAGISGQTLILQAVACGLRLSSTTWLQGYIPVDGTGDWLYQAVDALALLILLNIIYCIFKSHQSTYQNEHDNIRVEYIALTCFVLAVLVHPDLNNRPVFDTLWTTALYIDVVAMAPQLVMISKIREVEALTSHFVSATAISRLISLIFWYHGFAELAPLDGSFNLAGWAIIAAHVLQVLLLGDFLMYYIRACLSTGSARFELPTYSEDV
jgi:hypothetical protein